LREEQLSPVETIAYSTRDGAQIWGYLTTPRGAPRSAPLIVMPHGGPESRDVYGFDTLAQFLASRGYLVFQPQFRGSGGFGRAFAELGYRQWGQRMQNDVTDGVRHLIETGRADASRICIFGASYGGYAALAGAAFTPDLYRCAVSWAGVSDLVDLVRDERRYGSIRRIRLCAARRWRSGSRSRHAHPLFAAPSGPSDSDSGSPHPWKS
jgi:dipeptidyl aminopeptidase/acylaminoacyl peptidase